MVLSVDVSWYNAIAAQMCWRRRQESLPDLASRDDRLILMPRSFPITPPLSQTKRSTAWHVPSHQLRPEDSSSESQFLEKIYQSREEMEFLCENTVAEECYYVSMVSPGVDIQASRFLGCGSHCICRRWPCGSCTKDVR